MKLWRFTDPKDDRFARATRRGSWEGSPSKRVSPLIIEWEPGSDRIGDFTWSGFDSEIVVTENVTKVLADANVHGYDLAPVEMIENSEPEKRASKEPRVKLPYSGPQLWELWVDSWVKCDRERSTLREITDSSRKGPTFEVTGVEKINSRWDPKEEKLVRTHESRKQGQGIFIQSRFLGKLDIFRIQEVPAWIFCTDAVRDLIKHYNFTNVSFFEMGEILSE